MASKFYEVVLCSQKTSTGAGDTYKMSYTGERSIQATLEKTSGNVTATVYIQVSNDNIGWLTLATYSLDTAGTASDGFALTAPWRYVRAYVYAVQSGGKVTATMVGVRKDEIVGDN